MVFLDGNPTVKAGVMDMVSTTGVEVMTEVVTEAAVGEVPVADPADLLPVIFPFRSLPKNFETKTSKNTEQIDSTPQKGTWNPGVLCCELSNLLVF